MLQLRNNQVSGLSSFSLCLEKIGLLPDSRLLGSWSETSLEEAPKSISKMPRRVNSLGPNPWLLIALHSPYALLETGLRMCRPEKSQDKGPLLVRQSVLCSPVCLGIIAKYGHV